CRFVETPNDFVIAAIAHADDFAARKGGGTVSLAEARVLPQERRAVFGPFLEQASLGADGVAPRSAPLRPIQFRRAAVLSRNECWDRQQKKRDPNHGATFRSGSRTRAVSDFLSPL